MYYLKDNQTGGKYEISSKKLLFTRTIPVLSLVLYGVFLAFVLSLFELSINVSFTILLIAYVVEIIIWFSNKCSVANLIGAVLLLILWRSIFSQILDSTKIKSPTVSSSKLNEVVKIYKSCETKGIFSV
ncbi:MAG: hypothetical protein KAI84_10835 [Gammaproteobacteria bacterium]|nr:hypothetical protein [Gammaproteobacteria bacterium]